MGRGGGGGGRNGGSSQSDARTPGQRATDEYGGRTWEKGGHSRVYMGKREMLDEAGVEIVYRRTGSIERASIGGERLSASQAGAIAWNAGSVYVDNKTGVLHSPKLSHPSWRSAMDRVAAKIGASGVVYD